MTAVKTISEFVYQEVPERKMILAPWLQSGELVMIYAPTGVGKSMFSISLAHSLATGRPFLCWQNSMSWRVCYIEAEMGLQTTKARLVAEEAASPVSASPENFLLICRDSQTNHLANIGTPEGQAELLPILAKYDVIILDNLTSAALPINGRDDDVRIWYRLKPFLFHLRNSQKTFILVHHSGKSGDQLGTSLRGNDMDTIIKLSRPVKQLSEHALGMQVRFEKHRNVKPGTVRDIYAEYSSQGAGAMWCYQDLNGLIRQQIRETAHTIKNKVTLAQMFHVPLLEVYEALKEPEPTRWMDGADEDEEETGCPF